MDLLCTAVLGTMFVLGLFFALKFQICYCLDLLGFKSMHILFVNKTKFVQVKVIYPSGQKVINILVKFCPYFWEKKMTNALEMSSFFKYR